MSAVPESGVESYGEFLKDELASQDARKSSFEQRGLAVITTSGALVTLLFALAALSTKKEATFVLPASAQDWLGAALILFFSAAVAALVTNLPLSYQAANPDDVKALLMETPISSKEEAATHVALARVAVLTSAKSKNGFKGWVLLAAMVLEVLAVGCVSKAVSLII